MVFRTAIGALVVVTACGRPTPAPTFATGPTPDEFSVYELPDPCAPLLDRVNARGPQRLPAWVELARCVATSAIALADLDDSADSVALLDEMTAPSFVLLEHVIGTGPVAAKIAALRARAGLYGEMSEQMLATATRRSRRAKVEDLIVPWQAKARETHQRIVALGDAHPEIASNPSARLAIRDSERQLAVPIATRED